MTPPSAGPMTEIAIIVRYQAMAGNGDQVAALLGRHTAATRAEPGCRDFVALRGTEDPDSFVLYERYDSREAFDAHLASPHFSGIAVAQIRPLLRERTLEFCQVVAPEAEP
jgi:quinol monooxygenase YgiN